MFIVLCTTTKVEVTPKLLDFFFGSVSYSSDYYKTYVKLNMFQNMNILIKKNMRLQMTDSRQLDI